MTLRTRLVPFVLLAGAAPAWGQDARPAVPPESRLDALIGSYDVAARLFVQPGAEPLVGTGEATFERSRGGKVVHEHFALSFADRAIAGDAWIAWREALGRYQLSQVDDANPLFFWLLGAWDADRGRLSFHDLDGARPPGMLELRWEYRITFDGGFVKEMLRPDGNGGWALMSDYHYTPKPGGGERPRATHVTEPVRVPMAPGMSHIVIDVSIDGKGPFPMILDTGAATSVLDEELVRELGLSSLGTTRIGDPSDPLANEVDRVEIKTVEIGGARFEGVQAVGWRGASLTAGIGARGVIGLPTFRDCLLTIDYPRREVELAPGALPDIDGKQVIALDSSGIAIVPIEIAGRVTTAHLDVGNGSSLVLPAEWQSEVKVKGELRKGAGMRASGPAEFTIATLDGDVRLGEHVFHDPEVRFDSGLHDVNVGYELLKGLVLTLDQANGRLRLSPGAGGPNARTGGPVQAPAEGRRRLGAALGMRSDGVAEIRMVVPDSQAEAAGLLVGDVIVTVDGKPATNDALTTALAGAEPIRLGVRRGDGELEIVLFAR